MRPARAGRVTLVALLVSGLAWGGARADTPGYPAQLAELVSATRATILKLPAEQRTPDDVALLRGPMDRLLACSLQETPAPRAAVSRAWEGSFESSRRSLASPQALRADAREILLWWHEGGARERMRTEVPAELFERADNAVEAYNDALLEDAIRLVSRRLDRYEVKYGPGSPKLNFVEVGLNTALQGTAWFKPNHEGPSPNELLVSYSTAWVTVTEDEAKAVSTLELGWRRYNLDWRSGERAGWSAMLRPRYVAIGLVAAEQRDGALRWPLNSVSAKETRLGPYLTFGDLKVAYLFGPESRLLVSKQVQFLPNLF
jgi:hypothetical protein